MRRYGENWRGGKAGIMRHSKRMSIVHEEGGEMLVLEGLSINATPWHTILYLLLLFNDLTFFGRVLSVIFEALFLYGHIPFSKTIIEGGIYYYYCVFTTERERRVGKERAENSDIELYAGNFL